MKVFPTRAQTGTGRFRGLFHTAQLSVKMKQIFAITGQFDANAAVRAALQLSVQQRAYRPEGDFDLQKCADLFSRSQHRHFRKAFEKQVDGRIGAAQNIKIVVLV